MACPTCDHTMNRVGEAQGDPVWHCPRCGTVVVAWGCKYGVEEPDVCVPQLVDRCRELGERFVGRTQKDIVNDWKRLGILEAIHKPEDRS